MLDSPAGNNPTPYRPVWPSPESVQLNQARLVGIFFGRDPDPAAVDNKHDLPGCELLGEEIKMRPPTHGLEAPDDPVDELLLVHT